MKAQPNEQLKLFRSGTVRNDHTTSSGKTGAGRFKWNEHGVCTNPERLVMYSDNKAYAAVDIAEHKGNWYTGMHYEIKGTDTGSGGGGGLPSKNRSDKFPTREAAINDGVSMLKRTFKRWDGMKGPCKKVLDALNNHKQEKPAPGSPTVTTDHTGPKIERGEYFGGKGADGTYQTLINLIPPHKTYISLFAGKCAVRYHMKGCDAVYMFDRDEKIVQWWKKWRKGNAGILTFDAQCKNALDVLDEPWLTTATWLGSTFIFCDPPFPHSTRKNPTEYKYKFEMTDADHVKLCKVLHKDYRDCMVMLCTIENDIYNKLLKGWHKVKYWNMTRRGRVQECLYMNYAPPEHLHDYSFLGDNFEDRRRIKRKIKRHVEKLRKLPVKERNAIIHTIQQYQKHIYK